MAEIQALFVKMESIPEMIETPKAKGQKVHTWLSTRQVKALAATCDKSTIDGLRDAVVLGLLVGAGLRRQELAALTWDKVKFQPCGDKMRTVLEITGKGSKTRTVPISDGLAALLDTWAETTGKEGYVARALGRSLELGESLGASAILTSSRNAARQ
jgi:site-specific recombinase XerD